MKVGCLMICLLGLAACKNRWEGMHFTRMDAGHTHIDFSNKITESDSLNLFMDEYMYNGSGVGVGDFNNDGLPDLFFCGSMVSSRLYINKGSLVFEDVTVAAGLQTTGIKMAGGCTGVSIVDINNDGFLDIYVCVSHSRDPDRRKNMLFINDGKLHFTEEAEAYGLADTGYSTQAAFLDYDKDGDLDMYLLDHEIYSHTANDLRPKDTSGNAPAEDRLYRNDGAPGRMMHPVFHDVSASAGIREDGYGLGVVVSDINGDGWPDIYVANDYLANDLLWLNRGDGRFTNVIAAALRHQSYNSMGTDAADINNDGLPDLAVVDMLPETNERKKMMFSATSQAKFDMQQRFGYEPSYVRNMLQLNCGVRATRTAEGTRRTPGPPEGTPFFSEIGQLAGIFQTDWSWSVLMADLDNDGWKDIYITNGLGKDVTNNDYATFAAATEGGYTFGASAPKKKDISAMRKALDKYGSVKMKSYLFHNNGGYTFSDVSSQSGIVVPAIVNGAVYVDLDNDGDLDLVTNNINEDAFVWRNDIRASAKDSTHNFLAVQLRGPAGNVGGLGCKVLVFDNGRRQLLEESPVRGFSSSVDGRLYFGVGNARSVDSLYVQWLDGRVQVIKDVKTDQWITVWYGDAIQQLPATQISIPLFKQQPGIEFKHKETPHYDFGDHQPVLQKYSQMGPCIATGDVNGDGLEDLFVGGAANQSGKIYIQQPNGAFTGTDLVQNLKPEEDLGAIFFDADGDKDLDLLITGGSTEFGVPKYNQPRLYLNDGHGRFMLSPDALPVITDITKAIAVTDYDEDGDMDVFIGGRLSPGEYPQSPGSYILQNDHGKFMDVTATVCPALAVGRSTRGSSVGGQPGPGMITDAVFTDIDGDKKPDLVVCGEWMGIRFFRNKGKGFEEMTGVPGMHGLWRCIQAVDLDKDGDVDLVVGNMGLNNKYGATAARPMMLYAKDMDNNGTMELVPAYYIKDRSGEYQLYPALDRNQLAQETPVVKKKYLLHKDYSTVTMAQLKDDFGGDGWMELKCETAASVWLENLGGGRFKIHELPLEAQFAPLNSIVAEDVDGDGSIDLIVAGNEYQTEAGAGRYDASYGLVLRGDSKGGFTPMDVAGSGLVLDGDIRDMKIIRTEGTDPEGRPTGKTASTGRGLEGRLLIAAPNDGELKTFQIR